jgi:hypothetical protein
VTLGVGLLPTVQARVESRARRGPMERGPVEVLFGAFPDEEFAAATQRLLV